MVFLAVFLSDSLKNFAEETNYVDEWRDYRPWSYHDIC